MESKIFEQNFRNFIEYERFQNNRTYIELVEEVLNCLVECLKEIELTEV